MKKISLSLLALVSLNAFGNVGILCYDDRRTEGGARNEIMLSPTDEGYVISAQSMLSRNDPVHTEIWAQNLSCRIDDKLAYCENKALGQIVSIISQTENYYDSIEKNAKKKTKRNAIISLTENGIVNKSQVFEAGDCEDFGNET